LKLIFRPLCSKSDVLFHTKFKTDVSDLFKVNGVQTMQNPLVSSD